MLLLVNVLVLLTAATQLNAAFLFFADWTDLRNAFGGSTRRDRPVPRRRRCQGGAPAGGRRRGPGGHPAAAAAPGVGSSGVITYTVRGPASGLVGTVVVQLPPTYRYPRLATERYPVIETFHGYSGYPALWITLMNLGGVMAQEVAAGQLRRR